MLDEEKEAAKQRREYFEKERKYNNQKKAEIYASQGSSRDELYLADQRGQGGWNNRKGAGGKGSNKGGKKGKGGGE